VRATERMIGSPIPRRRVEGFEAGPAEKLDDRPAPRGRTRGARPGGQQRGRGRSSSRAGRSRRRERSW